MSDNKTTTSADTKPEADKSPVSSKGTAAPRVVPGESSLSRWKRYAANASNVAPASLSALRGMLGACVDRLERAEASHAEAIRIAKDEIRRAEAAEARVKELEEMVGILKGALEAIAEDVQREVNHNLGVVAALALEDDDE